MKLAELPEILFESGHKKWMSSKDLTVITKAYTMTPTSSRHLKKDSLHFEKGQMK
jgi:ribonuclease PH